MLRNFEYHPDETQILEILKKFGFNIKDVNIYIDLLSFEVISPDSFLWKLLLNQKVHYLYAEDFVSGLEYITNTLNQYLKGIEWRFIEPLKTVMFESATPVKAATVYHADDDSEAMMKYVVESGHDFVFLVESNEDAERAKFSEKW